MPLRRLITVILLTAWPTVRAYQLISPEPFLVQRTEWIKLHVTVAPGEPVPDSVVYTISYLAPGSRASTAISVPFPFEHLFDCRPVHDGAMYFRAAVHCGRSMTTLGTEFDFRGLPVMLDRTTGYKTMTHRCAAAGRTAAAPDSFAGGNNRLRFSSAWDADSLYLSVSVRDAHLNMKEPELQDIGPEKGYFRTLWESDGLEICFDTRHDRTEWRALDDYEFIVNIAAAAQGNVWNRRTRTYRHWDGVRALVLLAGTPNSNADTDSGYTVGLGIPWTALDHVPVPGETLGFDIQMFDRDAPSGKVFRSIWSNAEEKNNDNTSDWGNLVLAPPPGRGWRFRILTICGALLILIIIRTVRIRKKRKVNPPVEPAQNPVIENIKAYINGHYMEPELNRQHIAKHVNLNERYISTLFKKEQQISLVDYINRIRTEKAMELLTDPGLQISDIAFKVGFSTLQNFNRAFKKATGMSPSDFRKTL